MEGYEIVGRYKESSELLDTAESRREANRLLGEYQLAFGPEWFVYVRRIK